MDFTGAVSALQNGDQVRRNGWMPGAVISVDNGGSIASVIDGKVHPELFWKPSLSDFTASDWMIHVPRPGESAPIPAQAAA